MVEWGKRHFGYKLGFCGLVFSILVYVVGFALPYWSILRLRAYGMLDRTVGLWQACNHPSSSSPCESNVHGDNPPWLNASRAMCSLAVVMFVMAMWSGCYRNVSKFGQQRCKTPGRHVEWLSIIACLVGLVGCTIFAMEFQRIYKELGHLYWAFAIIVCALVLNGISAGLMVYFNRDRYHRRRRSTTSTTISARGPNGFPVAIQFQGEDRLHIPYYGEISRDDIIRGAGPMQPPSYEMVTGEGEGGYAIPPQDVSDAPPLYEDVTKECVVSAPEVVADESQDGNKENENDVENERDPGNGV